MNYSGSTYTTEERIKLAGDEKKDRLYEPKQNQKAIKVLTVAAYVLCVSLAAIMLSFYYIFIWNSSTKPNLSQPRAVACDKIVMPDGLEKLLANASEISLETFLKNYSMLFKLDPNKLIEIEVKHLRPQLTEPLKQQQATIANNNSSNNINNENNVDYYLASVTQMSPKIAPESPTTEITTESLDSSLFLSDLPVAASLSSSPSGLLIKKLKEINQSNRKDKASNKKNLEIDEDGDGEDENGDNDDDNDDDDEDDDTEQEDYYEPSGQKEITDKFINNNNKTAKNFNQ